MTVLRIAKIAGARRVIAERLAGTGCNFPDEVAREVIDELLKLGWTFPGWQLVDEPGQPSTSSPAARREAREAVAAAVAAAKQARGEKYGNQS